VGQPSSLAASLLPLGDASKSEELPRKWPGSAGIPSCRSEPIFIPFSDVTGGSVRSHGKEEKTTAKAKTQEATGGAAQRLGILPVSGFWCECSLRGKG
jgi:hypothetical protein